MAELSLDSITFGKYKGKTLDDVLKDRKYCSWLLQQEWFLNYEYLHNRVKEYNPSKYFLPEEMIDNFLAEEDFIEHYPYFNLTQISELQIELSPEYKSCYAFYLETINDLRNKLIIRHKTNEDNIFNIKAPSKWLKKFETTYNLKRETLKQFLYENDLPNIPYIVERIKKEGGIEYGGCKGWIIAKQKSEDQEAWWETRLKAKYGEDISTQFKFNDCNFDFLNIKKNILYEAKLGIKDFDEAQYRKYLLTLNHYEMIYLIGRDTIIHIPERKIYIQGNSDMCEIFRLKQSTKRDSEKTKFDDLLENFEIQNVENIEDVL